MNAQQKSELASTILQIVKAGSGVTLGCPVGRINHGLRIANYHPAEGELDVSLADLVTLGYLRLEEDPLNAGVRYYFPTAEGLKHLQRLGLA